MATTRGKAKQVMNTGFILLLIFWFLALAAFMVKLYQWLFGAKDAAGNLLKKLPKGLQKAIDIASSNFVPITLMVVGVLLLPFAAWFGWSLLILGGLTFGIVNYGLLKEAKETETGFAPGANNSGTPTTM